MKLKELITSVACYLFVAFNSQAQVTVSLEWQFATGDNPTAPTSSVNPLGAAAAAAASITVGIGSGYFPSNFQNSSLNYGSPTGIWNTAGNPSDTGNGFQLLLNAAPATPSTQLSYTLQIDQFINNGGFPDAGNLTISPGPAGSATRSTTPLATGNEGGWYRDTYTWQVTPSAGPLMVTIGPDPVLGYQDITIDRIQWTITGDLTAVPESGLLASVTAGALAFFALWRLRQREA